MIELSKIFVSYDSLKALDGVDLNVKQETLLGIVGPGGSGKSSLCKVVAGLVTPHRGSVVVNGTDYMSANRKKMMNAQKQIGVQFQNDALFEHISVLDNVAYPLTRLTDLSKDRVEAKSLEYLAMVGLSGFEFRYPSNLSGGQRRRVALARACVTDPKILICDDPTAGLDPLTSRKILDMIAGIRYQTGSTMLVVSSDIVGLFSISTRIAMVWGGKVLLEGATSLFTDSRDSKVQKFLDDARLPFEGWKWD